MGVMLGDDPPAPLDAFAFATRRLVGKVRAPGLGQERQEECFPLFSENNGIVYIVYIESLCEVEP
jgi:hypothetical protein